MLEMSMVAEGYYATKLIRDVKKSREVRMPLLPPSTKSSTKESLRKKWFGSWPKNSNSHPGLCTFTPTNRKNMALSIFLGMVGPWQIVLIVALVLLLFGGRKIR